MAGSYLIDPTPVDLLGPRALTLPETPEWSHVIRSLLLQRELETVHRDEWGNWDGQFLQNPSDLAVPFLDHTLLDGWKPNAWPEGRPFCFVASFDIDSLRASSVREYAVRMRRGPLTMAPRLIRGALRNLARQREGAWDFVTWLGPLRSAGFSSTWFAFPDRPAEWCDFDCVYRWTQSAEWSRGQEMCFRDALEKCGGEGHEVGLHGSFNSAVRPGHLEAELRDSERLLGAPIRSIRQHYLHFDPELTPSLQQSAGFQVDSSVGMNRHLGFRSGTSFPYFLWDHRRRRATTVLEIPVVVQDGPLVRDVQSGALRGFSDALQRALRLMDEVERTGGCYTILFHPDGLDKPLRHELYCAIVEEAARRRAWGATLSEVRARWLCAPSTR
ncbi:MAG: hypothetical protein ACREL3_08535 [Gemmatimonadales bacterium]